MPSTEHGWPSVLARLSSPSAGSAVREAHLDHVSIDLDLTIDRVRLICCASPQGRVSGQGLYRGFNTRCGGVAGELGEHRAVAPTRGPACSCCPARLLASS
jgi:hypothetical protein